jgi:hypothetical protein
LEKALIPVKFSTTTRALEANIFRRRSVGQAAKTGQAGWAGRLALSFVQFGTL